MSSKILSVLSSNTTENVLVKPYVIAEIGVNHEGSMKLAKRLIDDAKSGGADAVKFQTYRADSIAIKDSPAYWNMAEEPTNTQYQLFKKHESFWKDEMQELKDYCDKVNIEFMSTPFDFESANFLNDMMDVFKISSSDITNKPFIEYICNFKKPIILSTGASNLAEIIEAVDWIEKTDCPSVALLHCVLNYPTQDKNANLGMIIDLKSKFPNKVVGYSDHTLPKDMRVCEIASILGCRIIEKHFTHDKTMRGNDHYHAMDKDDLQFFRKNINKLFDILGGFEVDSLPSEKLSQKNARRSLVALRDIEKNKIVTREDLTFKRPANGVSPKYINDIIGKKTLVGIQRDDILQWHMFK